MAGRRQKNEEFDPFEMMASALSGATTEYDTSKLQDPFKFVFEHCRTLDPHDKADPIKRFPDHEYLRDVLKLFLSEQLVVVAKSRQLMISWLTMAYALWVAMAHKGAVVFVVSKKEADAGYDNDLSLLSRARFMYDHLPNELKIPREIGLQPPVFKFPAQYSSITGLPQDSDALRQYTARLVVCDEWAFQEKAREAYAAMRPTIAGGGQLIGVSTSNGKSNLFSFIVHDEILG